MSTPWSSFTKGIVLVGLLLVAVWLLNRFESLLAPVVTALLLAYLLNLPVNLLIRRTGLSRTPAVVLVYLIGLVILIALPALFGPRLVDQVAALQIDLRALEEALQRFSAQPIVIFNLRLDAQAVLDQALATLGDIVSPVASGALTLVADAAEAIGWLLFVLVVSFLLIKDINALGRFVDERIPPALAPDFYRLGTELSTIWNAFLRGRLVLSIVIMVAMFLILTLLGVPNALILGLVTGILDFIPSIGSVLAGVIAALVALARGSTYLPISNLALALIVTGVYIAFFQFESLYLFPRVVGRRVQLHPVVVIIGSIAGALIAGVLGLLLAAPIIASARVLLAYIFAKLLDQDPFPAPKPPQPLGVTWRGYIRGHPIAAVLFDMDGTLVETDDWAVASMAERLQRFRFFLPQGDTQRAARRLVMWSHDGLNDWLALLDRVGLDGPAQRLAQRAGLINENTSDLQLVPVAGTSELLRGLSGRYKLGIVSTRHCEEVSVYLEQQGLMDTVDVVAGCDTTKRIKPHPEPVLWAVQQLGVAPENAIMVGDTSADIVAGKAAGALAVGVLCGFGEREDFDQADLILNSTAELLEWL